MTRKGDLIEEVTQTDLDRSAGMAVFNSAQGAPTEQCGKPSLAEQLADGLIVVPLVAAKGREHPGDEARLDR